MFTLTHTKTQCLCEIYVFGDGASRPASEVPLEINLACTFRRRIRRYKQPSNYRPRSTSGPVAAAASNFRRRAPKAHTHAAVSARAKDGRRPGDETLRLHSQKSLTRI